VPKHATSSKKSDSRLIPLAINSENLRRDYLSSGAEHDSPFCLSVCPGIEPWFGGVADGHYLINRGKPSDLIANSVMPDLIRHPVFCWIPACAHPRQLNKNGWNISFM